MNNQSYRKDLIAVAKSNLVLDRYTLKSALDCANFKKAVMEIDEKLKKGIDAKKIKIKSMKTYSSDLKLYKKIIENLYLLVNDLPEKEKIEYWGFEKIEINHFTKAYIIALMSLKQNKGSFLYKIKKLKFDEITDDEKTIFLNEIIKELQTIIPYGYKFDDWKFIFLEKIYSLSHKYICNEYFYNCLTKRIENFVKKSKVKDVLQDDWNEKLFSVVEEFVIKHNQNQNLLNDIKTHLIRSKKTDIFTRLSEQKQKLAENSKVCNYDYLSYAKYEWNEYLIEIFDRVKNNIIVRSKENEIINEIDNVLHNTISDVFPYSVGENILVPKVIAKGNGKLDDFIDEYISLNSNLKIDNNSFDERERAHILSVLKSRVFDTVNQWKKEVELADYKKITDDDYDIITEFI